jgi:hypothetical protein
VPRRGVKYKKKIVLSNICFASFTAQQTSQKLASPHHDKICVNTNKGGYQKGHKEKG